MNLNDLFTNTQFATLTAPVKKLNTLAIDNFEKLAQLQLDNAKSYAELGLSQLRAALEISDAKGFQAYISGQQQTAKTIGDKIAKDATVVGDLAKQFTSELQKLVQEQAQTLSGLAQAKKAA